MFGRSRDDSDTNVVRRAPFARGGVTAGSVFTGVLVSLGAMAVLVGIIGGAVGILVSLGILGAIARFLPNGEALRLDGEMLLVAAFLSLVAGLVAGVYPAWRVCSVPPAMQLKVQ